MRRIIKALSLTTVAVAVIAMAFNETKASFFKTVIKASEANPYTLNFSSLGNNNSESEQSTVINTAGNNNLEISFSNVISYNNGWQTIKPDGYFYNPINNYNAQHKPNTKNILFLSCCFNSV